MPRICFCPGCKTGYTSNTNQLKKEGKKVPPLFGVPKDPYLFEMWQKAIPRADRMLRPKDYVCELHFKKEEVLNYYETKLPNGVIHRLLRGRPALIPGAIPSIFPNVPGHSTFVENRATKLKEKIAKRKKISCPKKKNETKKKNDSSHQTGKENILMEVIVVQPLPENSASAQPSHLRENQNIKAANSSLSISEKHARSEPDALAFCLFPGVNSAQNVCNKILTEFPSADKLVNNYNEQNSSITNVTESYVPDSLTDNYSKQNITNQTITVSSVLDIRTENYSKQSSSDKTIIEASVPDISTENFSERNSSDKSIIESPVPDALIENYSEQNSADRAKTVSSVPDILTENYCKQNSSDKSIFESPVPDALIENYSKRNSSDRTITESSVPDALVDHSICEVVMTEYPTHDTQPYDFSDQSNDNVTLNESFSAKPTVSDADRIICDKIRAKLRKILSEPDIEEQVSFDFLKANIDMFETTDSWWRVNAFNNFIVFSRWNSDYAVDRRIVITKDLAVKVFLLDKETTIGQNMKKFSICDIAKLIYRVENLKLCSGIDKKNRNCAGFLESVFMCKRYNLCLSCIKWRKEEAKKAIKQLKESPNWIELLNFNLIT